MKSFRNPTATAFVFIWIGFVCAISFMEAWLKFQAPGITLELGLGIGKLVFGALNKVEWAFAVIILISLFLTKDSLLRGRNLLLIFSIIIVALQTFWLLPALFDRANLHIEAQNISKNSFVHYFYIAVELLKVVILTIFGISNLKRK